MRKENSYARPLRLGFVVTSILLASAPALGQLIPSGDPGANVNIVGPTPDPADIRDEQNKQQNEPSCSVRPGDADCFICGFNDYRTVDQPLIQDAWQGVAMSCDGAVTWTSRIAPGHPAHVAPIGTEFAADPRMTSLPGMAIFAFIGGNRDEDTGVMAVQHWLENLQEDGDYYEPGKFTYIADAGNSGRFIDKPDAMAVVDLPNKQGTITLSTEMENPELGTIQRDFPTGTLYVAYAVFTGSQSVKVLVKESNDWGQTWTNQAFKLSESQNLVSGISLTSIGDTPMVIWRRAGDNNDFDSIMYSYKGKSGKWAKGAVLADICSFDQISFSSSTAVTFRTNDFPWLANDGKNFYAFFSDRNWDGNGDCSAGRPRIVMKYASNPADLADAPLVAIDDSDDGDPMTTEDAGGSFQFMPAATGARGKVQVAWYDTRREGIPGGPALIADYYDAAKGANVNRKVDVYSARIVSDANGDNVQISPPVRVSQFRIGARVETVDGEQQAGSVAIEGEASFANAKMYASGTLSFIGDYLAVAAQELRFDENGKVVSNASAITDPLTDKADFFIAWTDNRDVRGNIFEPNNLENTVPYAPPENPVGMADNEEQATPDSNVDETPALADTKAERVGDAAVDGSRSLSTEGVEDPYNPVPDACVFEDPQDRTRNANIYGARIRDQVRLTAPTPTRPLTNLQRSLPVILTNANDAPQSYRLRITNQPSDAPLLGRASFRQLPAVPPFDGPDLPPPTVVEDLTVPQRSASARTVFLVSNLTDASTGVEVFEKGCVDSNPETYYEGACPVVASVRLSGEGPSGTLRQPNYESPICDLDGGSCTDDVLQAELHNPELINPELINPELINPELINPELINPELINPELINPELINPELINLGFANPELINPELINPELINPELINPELINPELINPELINSTVGDDLTWTDYTFIVKNTGNVTTALDADITLGGTAAGDVDSQIIAWTLYITPTSRNCEYLPQFERRVLATVNNPDNILDIATIDEPFNGAVSAVAVPGQNMFFTRRVFGSQEELDNVHVAGFMAASQAANCSQTDRPLGNTDPYFCQLQLADARERILIDSSPPVFNLSNEDPIPVPPIEADRPGGACVDLVGSGIISATDDGGSATVSCTDVLGAQICTSSEPGQSIPVRTLANPDPALVSCTAVDEVGNDITVQFGIDVQDNQPPMFTSTFPTTVIVDAGVDGTAIVDLENNVEAVDFDGVDPDPIEMCIAATGQASGQPIAAGTTTINCTATDASGNPVQKSYILQVNDVTAPQFIDIPLPDISVASTSASGSAVTYDIPAASDASDSSPVVSCSPLPGSVFPIGTTPVTCTATDASGNSATAIFDVTVSDAEPPVIVVPTNGIDATLESSAGAIVDYSASVSVTDNTDPSPTLACTPKSGSLFPPSTTTVNCEASDSSGNTSSASFEVRVGYSGGFGISVTKTRMKAGSSNPLGWGWLGASGETVDSSGDMQILSILDCATGGTVFSISAGDPGSSGFRVKSDNSWEFNFQADYPDTTPLPRGTYCAVVESSVTGQKLYSPEIRVR